MPVCGTCALCQREGQDLQRSHFLPAGVYRATRDESQMNPNPVMINDEVSQDSKQVTAHVLCAECEQRLNRKGENWFLANCSRNGKFRLAQLLEGLTPIHAYSRLSVYSAGEVSEIDVAALAYFVASMFWRAAVCAWPFKNSSTRQIDLGPYLDQVRAYLMDQSSFPENCVLWVTVPMTMTPFTKLSLTPYGGRAEKFHIYKLVVLGVGFYLIVGSRIPALVREKCFIRGNGNPLFRSDMLELAAMMDLSRKFKRNPRLLEGPKHRR